MTIQCKLQKLTHQPQRFVWNFRALIFNLILVLGNWWLRWNWSRVFYCTSKHKIYQMIAEMGSINLLSECHLDGWHPNNCKWNLMTLTLQNYGGMASKWTLNSAEWLEKYEEGKIFAATKRTGANIWEGSLRYKVRGQSIHDRCISKVKYYLLDGWLCG